MEIVAAIAVCLLMEGLFTGAEMVLVSASRHTLLERSRRGERGAALALALLSRPDRTLATTLTGTNVCVVLSTVLATSHLLPRLGENADWAAVAIVTPLVILLGEIVPKSFSRPRADRLVVPAARFLSLAQWPLYPLVVMVSWLGRTLSRPFGRVPPLHGRVTREELRLMLRMSKEGGDVEPHERAMVRRVFHFGEKKVSDIFRPIAQVAALPEDATCRDAAVVASRSGFSRYPVYRGRHDQVVGFLHIMDTLGHDPKEPVLPLLRKAVFVPELMPVDQLMRRFQEAGTSFAVVVDEFGGITGIVTAEDVVEEVVGEIEDEYDRRMDYYEKISATEFIVPGKMEVGRVEEEFGVRLPEGDYATVGGLLTALAERIPAVGQTFSVPGARFEVVRASERAVLDVRLLLLPAEEAGEPPRETGE